MEKERKIPEIPYLEQPHEIEGPPKEARESFYEFAKKRVRYLTQKEIVEWDKIRGGDPKLKRPLPTLYFLSVGNFKRGDNIEKWVNNLEIVVNKDAFKIRGKDYSDLIPFVLEHEIYESWLGAKKGAGSTLETKKHHILALRKAFLLAEQQGLGEKLLEWNNLIDPKDTEKNRKYCEYALRVAKKQSEYLKNKK